MEVQAAGGSLLFLAGRPTEASPWCRCVGGGRVRSKGVCLLEVAVVARAEVVGGCYVIPASAFCE
jgi:hypothetical protein